MTFAAIIDNQVRYQEGSRAGHVESFFLKLNDPHSPKALWLRFTILSPKNQPQEATADLWAIAFDGEAEHHSAAKRSWRFSDSEAQLHRYPISLGKSILEPGYTRGSLEKAGTSIEWELRYTPGCRPMHLFPWEAMYTLPVPRSKTVTPYPDARFEGFYRVNGKEVKVHYWPGTQGHNWGKENAFLYAWSHCNVFFNDRGDLLEDTYFEGLSAKIKLGPLTTPFLSSAWLRYRGVDMPFTLKEIKRGAKASINAHGPYEWSFLLASQDVALEGSLTATREQMVGLYYSNPDSSMTYCLNSKIASLKLLLKPRHSAAVELTSKAAALEIGTRDPTHGVEMAL